MSKDDKAGNGRDVLDSDDSSDFDPMSRGRKKGKKGSKDSDTVAPYTNHNSDDSSDLDYNYAADDNAFTELNSRAR